MYPACPIDEYASSLTMFFCCNAMTFPTVIVSAASIANPGAHTDEWLPNATNVICMRPAKPAALDATERNAATGTGEPSYVSGAQKWKGTAETLKPNPTSTNPTMIRRMLAKTTESA